MHRQLCHRIMLRWLHFEAIKSIKKSRKGKQNIIAWLTVSACDRYVAAGEGRAAACVITRACNEPSRSFHNYEEGPYWWITKILTKWLALKIYSLWSLNRHPIFLPYTQWKLCSVICHIAREQWFGQNYQTPNIVGLLLLWLRNLREGSLRAPVITGPGLVLLLSASHPAMFGAGTSSLILAIRCFTPSPPLPVHTHSL